MTNGDGATWAEFAEDAPELASRIRARFSANLHHVIGTIRADGAPRLSGTEVEIGDDDVTSLVHVVGDELVFTTWRPGRGTREIRRR